MAELSFGQREVLGPVKTLLGGVTVLRMPMQRADYLHMMLDTHELVFSEGIATERFSTEAVTLEVLSPEALAELHAISPHLQESQQILSHIGLSMTQARYLMKTQTYGEVQAIQLCAA